MAVRSRSTRLNKLPKKVWDELSKNGQDIYLKKLASQRKKITKTKKETVLVRKIASAVKREIGKRPYVKTRSVSTRRRRTTTRRKRRY